MTLQCAVIFTSPDNTTSVQVATWERDGIGANTIPNHNVVFTGGDTNLEITNVRLENDSTVYTCRSGDNSITSSVVLNVTGNVHMYTVHVNMCVDTLSTS